MLTTLKNRIVLASVLPAEGDHLSLTLSKDIKNKIIITQDEITEMEIKVIAGEGGASHTTWNPKKDAGKEIEFTELELGLIKKTLQTLDANKKLTEETDELYKLFIA